jgi:hypothetical protein
MYVTTEHVKNFVERISPLLAAVGGTARYSEAHKHWSWVSNDPRYIITVDVLPSTPVRVQVVDRERDEVILETMVRSWVDRPGASRDVCEAVVAAMYAAGKPTVATFLEENSLWRTTYHLASPGCGQHFIETLLGAAIREPKESINVLVDTYKPKDAASVWAVFVDLQGYVHTSVAHAAAPQFVVDPENVTEFAEATVIWIARRLLQDFRAALPVRKDM